MANNMCVGILLSSCFLTFILSLTNQKLISCENNLQEFRVIHYWKYINFTWPSRRAYQKAFRSQQYVPLQNVLTGVKAFQDKLYISLPRFYAGTPVTLASLPMGSDTENPLLQPYPSWKMNEGKSCSTLQNVYSMEIDTKGVMWVLDGFRINNLTNCPPKIVLLDMNKGGTVLQTYIVPYEFTPKIGGWINDIVVDESDGGYAYITETSAIDPGLIVYSRRQNRAWKLRDRTMFAELDAAGYVVKGIAISDLHNIDGIALAPKSHESERMLYFTSLTGYNIYAIDVKILKNEIICTGSDWRKDVKVVGRKTSDTDGMIADNVGNLYYGLLTEYAIGKWNINKEPYGENMQVVYQNYTSLDWPDTFGMDTFGNLYVTATEIERIINTTYHPLPKDGILFRILQAHTGTRSYLYA